MYTLLIFDWDGTLIDSADRIVSSMQAAARDLRLPELAPEAIREIIGLGLPEALQQLFPGIGLQQIDAMRQRYGHHYLQADETPAHLFDGVRETLVRLKEEGYGLAVATGKSRRGLEQAFAETGLGELFDLSRCADETRSKPHPLMLHELLQDSGATPCQALMVGDTEFDLEMAQRAEVDAVAVSYGVHSVERLQELNPVMQINQFGELIPWLAGQKAKLSNID